MCRCLLQCLSVFAFSLTVTVPLPAQQPVPAAGAATAEAEVREAVHRYDAALRQADVAAAEQFWAPEYTFVNLRGERVTRDERIANLRTGRTSFDTVAYAPQDVQLRTYGNGDVVVETTLLSISGRYSGRAHHGRYYSLIVWVRRDGKWQQVASQLTPVLGK
jgi:ketosteroid isomerase-like protein